MRSTYAIFSSCFQYLILFQRSPSANTIGYMYEFDCKPTTTIGGNDPKIWGTIAFEKKVYVMYIIYKSYSIQMYLTSLHGVAWY